MNYIKNYIFYLVIFCLAPAPVRALPFSKTNVALCAPVGFALVYPLAHSADATLQLQLIGFNFGLGVIKHLLVKGNVIDKNHKGWPAYLYSAAVVGGNIDALVRNGGYKNKWDYLRAPAVHYLSYLLGSLTCAYLWPKDDNKKSSSNGQQVIINQSKTIHNN